jgi:hypothetical protein
VRTYERIDVARLANANLLHQDCVFLTAIAELTRQEVTLAAIFFASPQPPAKDEVMRRGEELKAAWKA